jgi:hypothetical protein
LAKSNSSLQPKPLPSYSATPEFLILASASPG